ncbi:MAG: hypothetical protein ACPGVP_06105, partial [Thiolinea sp.]
MLLKKCVIGFLLFFCVINAALANTDKVVSLAPGAPEVDANSFVLVDFQSGEELVALNQGMRVEPASITKLMTAY